MYTDEQLKQLDESVRQYRAFKDYCKKFPDKVVLIDDRHHFFDHPHYENFVINFKVK